MGEGEDINTPLKHVTHCINYLIVQVSEHLPQIKNTIQTHIILSHYHR